MATKNGVAAEPVPPLRDGDRLNLDEYWRRYEASPQGTRAELLGGVVFLKRREFITKLNGADYLVPPATNDGHARPQSTLNLWVAMYAGFTTGLACAVAPSIRLPEEETAPEPDAVLRILPEYGGATTVDTADYIHGPPELLVEVSNTTEAFDMGPKHDLYLRSGVREYVVLRPRLAALDWFVLRRRRYVPVEPDPADGLLKSIVFPGLWLDAAAVLRHDLRTVITSLQRGLASPEHAAFEAKLAAKAERLTKPKKRKK